MPEITATTAPRPPSASRFDIALINSSTMVTDDEARRVASALATQVTRDFAPWWGVDCDLSFYPRGKKPTNPKAWWLVIADDPTMAGALGYHDLNNDNYPVAYVFAKLIASYGEHWSSTASHEILEMLADPWIYSAAGPDNNGRWLALEVCDAVEAQEYAIGSVKVSNFQTPSWFGKAPGEQYDFLGKCRQRYQLMPGGYISYWTPTRGWQEDYAEKMTKAQLRKARPHLLSRRERRRVGSDRWITSEVDFDKLGKQLP